MKKIIGVSLVCVFVIMACAPPRALEYRSYRHLTIKDLGFDHSTLYLELEYFNPNGYGLQLEKTDFDIFINGTFLGHSTSDTTIRIPRKGTFFLPIQFDVNMQNAFKNAWSALAGEEILMRLKGKIKVGKGNVYISFPVEYETKASFSLF